MVLGYLQSEKRLISSTKSYLATFDFSSISASKSSRLEILLNSSSYNVDNELVVSLVWIKAAFVASLISLVSILLRMVFNEGVAL